MSTEYDSPPCQQNPERRYSLTGDSSRGAPSAETSFHEAIIVQDGKIAYVGDAHTPEVQNFRNTGSKVRDLGGRHVLPGFIDGHMHFMLLGQSLTKVRLDGSQDLDDIRARITAWAKLHPDKERILCSGWIHSMTDCEAKASMLDDLDQRPIYIDSKDLHSCWCNSAALEEMGVQEMKNPAGGTIERGLYPTNRVAVPSKSPTLGG